MDPWFAFDLPTTPRYTIDWYIKWVASAFILAAMSIRGVEGFVFYDVSLSIIGIFLSLTKVAAFKIVPSPPMLKKKSTFFN